MDWGAAMHRRMVLAGLAAVGAAACSDRKPGAGGAAKVRFATDWRAQAEHGGFYQALATGEYSKRGLDVEIVPGGPGVNVPQLIASGAADFGMGSSSYVVMNLAREKIPLKAVAAYFQKDPQVLMAHPDPALKSMADLKGRPILLADASLTGFWPWLKAKYGFTDDQVRKLGQSSAPFLSDPRAVMQGYGTSDPYAIEKAGGFKPQSFLLADAGFPSYATMVLASDKTIGEHPERVKAFVDASTAGWKSYLDGDPAAANKLILKDNPEMTQDLLDHARAAMKSMGIVESGSGAIGAMTDARWAEFQKVSAEADPSLKGVDAKQAYTLQFVK